MMDSAPETALDDDVLVDVDDESMTSDHPSVTEASLGKRETRVVSMFRMLLIAALTASALTLSLMAFFAARNGEYEDFKDAFEGHARKIMDTFEKQAVEKRTALVQLSRELTSHANFANSTWPFVTLPDWDLRTETTMQLADVIGLFVLPLVTKENFDKWGKYSMENQGWYWEGVQHHLTRYPDATNEVPEQYREGGENSTDHFFDDQIYQAGVDGPNGDFVDVEPNDPGPFFPCWQFSPQIPVPVVNLDFLTMPDAKAELEFYLQEDRQQTVVGPCWEFDAGTGGAAFVDLLLERYQGGRNGLRYEGGPLSYYYIPIFEELHPSSRMVGVTVSFVFWQTYFQDLLPDNANGIEIILDNTCGQSYTFGISGSESFFIGNDDRHETKYDHLGKQSDFGIFLQADHATYSNGGCLYRLSIYPTQVMEDMYRTNRPLIAFLSILGCFFLTVLAFIAYDTFVERRQKLVLKSAQESGQVVSKLFPEEVRDRLYQNEKKANHDIEAAKQTGFQVALPGYKKPSLHRSSLPAPLEASPIADEYPNCSVFFADLAGFTKWSSTRTPSEVFLLLETIYGAFDKIARKLRVFKVETIGDCYVAVTGLPKPQDDHAVILCRFAASCIVKFNQIVNSEDIITTLGDDTACLEMRVGIHSGAVTAGVLRGEKARFQLFGDTGNTASRMESTGQKGKIQVSPATRDLLVAARKEKWLTAREDLVEAKGKGKMQCYWVEVSNDGSATRDSIVSTSQSHSSSEPTEAAQTVASSSRSPSSLLEASCYEKEAEV